MMKTLKSLYAFLMLGLLGLPNLLMAQDSGTYIDNLNTQDSSYMSQDLLAGTEEASSGSNTMVIVIVVVIVIAVVAFLVLRKKKKK